MADCTNTSEGFPPFVDGVTTYLGEEVSLYPASNTIPAGHAAQLATAAAAVQKLDSSGNPAPAGKVVVLALGFSNVNQEYQEFIRTATDRAAHITLVNGAAVGRTSEYMAANWATYISGEVTPALSAKSVNANQVQVIWMKAAVASETGSFPTHAQTLQGYLKTIVESIASTFPNCQQVFISSRTYGGYASVPTSPEPWAYETGFAVKWLIEDQINYATTGDPDLDYSLVPVISWGPYLWSDGTAGRSYDSLVWNCSDFESDGTHPDTTGEEKVAALLWAFFQTEVYTSVWWYSIEPTVHDEFTGASVTSKQSASYTPTEGLLQIAIVASRGATLPSQPTVTGHGLTYTNRGTLTFSTIADPKVRMTVFTAPSSSPTPGAATVDWGAESQAAMVATVFEIDGVYNHSDGLVQIKTNRADSAASLSITMDAETIEVAMASFFSNISTSGVTPRSGWTEISEHANSSPNIQLETQFLAEYDGTASASKSGGGSMNMGGIAMGFRAPPPSYALEVTVVGSGTVASSPAGISCGSSCEASFVENTSVDLTATAGLGYEFLSWSGDHDSAVANVATVAMDATKQITATFGEAFAGTIELTDKAVSRVTLRERAV